MTLLPTNLIVMHVSTSKRKLTAHCNSTSFKPGWQQGCYKKLLSRLHLGTPCLRQQHLREAVYLVNLVIIKRRWWHIRSTSSFDSFSQNGRPIWIFFSSLRHYFVAVSWNTELHKICWPPKPLPSEGSGSFENEGVMQKKTSRNFNETTWYKINLQVLHPVSFVIERPCLIWCLGLFFTGHPNRLISKGLDERLDEGIAEVALGMDYSMVL